MGQRSSERGAIAFSAVILIPSLFPKLAGERTHWRICLRVKL
ncbi:hypothetical protein [Phormidium pseudopriestleyi]|nr:hypothetical protein [Phormidium pseudopriestleyi]